MTNSTYKQALERYHAIYNNDIYKTIRQQIVIDSKSDDGADSIIDFMNVLIDTCLECCGEVRYRESHVTYTI